MKILAIEDQPVAAMQLLAVLRALGHDADHAVSGDDAWAKLLCGGHRVIVSDWRMPGVDGLGLCRLIRERGGDYIYYILISSNRVTRENRRLALAAGVDDFLAKPVDADELGMRLHVADRILGLSAEVKRLTAFLPICGYCKKIRNDQKYWQEIETYFSQHQGTRFSHGVCPECYKDVLGPQLAKLGLDATPPPENPAG
ncbi:MAG: response regulator [Verrucomicrobia bacterium]|nr:response regulator [Verrucomicrobiota bacterium]